MPSPAKKRKFNTTSQPVPAKGLEFFFNRQKNLGGEKKENNSTSNESSQSASRSKSVIESDEELARRLQADWNAEAQVSALSEPTLPSSKQASILNFQEKREAQNDFKSQQSLPQSQADSYSPKKLSFSAGATLALQSADTIEDHLTASLPLDQNPLSFDPCTYITELKANWERESGFASYALLTRCFVLVNGNTSRIKIVDTLVNCLRIIIEADPQSLLPAVWLATNAIAPPYQSLELGIGSSIISKALKTSCGLDSRSLKALYNRLGDAGDVAFEARKKVAFTLRRPKQLTIKCVYETLLQIAKVQGKGSFDTKQKLVDKLLLAARGGEESRYIVRTLCQHVR